MTTSGRDMPIRSASIAGFRSCLWATVAIWSRVWLSWWALVPIALVVLWTWWNPRAFGKPASTNSWASQVTFGERLFLDRKANPIPQHHARWGLGLIWLSVIGLPFWAYGLWRFDPGLTLGKTWFADRMVWLYRDMTV